MKQCPVCKSQCFDDMDVCYGCMHRFDEGLLAQVLHQDDALTEFEVEEPRTIAADVPLEHLPAVSVPEASNLSVVPLPFADGAFDLVIGFRPKSARIVGEDAGGSNVVLDGGAFPVASAVRTDAGWEVQEAQRAESAMRGCDTMPKASYQIASS